MDNQPIGVFDSGVGGLTVLRELRRRMPGEDLLYVADQAHVPTGSRPLEEVRRYCFGIADFLLGRGAKLIVVACNTFSAAALQPLRIAHPHVPFVGMEPAVKPAAAASRSGVIGVIATEVTFQGELFANVVRRFGRGVKVITRTVPGLVERIEAGQTEGPELEAALRARLQDLIDAGIDELVLACTHYPFVRGALQNVLGPRVKIIDPAPSVARQAEKVLAERRSAVSGRGGTVAVYTSGDAESMRKFLRRTLGEEFPVRPVKWSGGDGEEKLMEMQGMR
jgi:glutamate racemase